MPNRVHVIDRSSFELRPFAAAARRLEANPNAWIETRLLMADLVRNAREPLPEVLVAHLRARLDGTARKRQGRGPADLKSRMRNLLIGVCFERTEAWLVSRQRRHGLEGWPSIRDADWWQVPPSERAARVVQHRVAPTLSWERVRNIAYEIRDSGRKK